MRLTQRSGGEASFVRLGVGHDEAAAATESVRGAAFGSRDGSDSSTIPLRSKGRRPFDGDIAATSGCIDDDPDTEGMTTVPGIVVISPHLDDAVLSVGATMHRAVRRGHRVGVVSVFAGDPERDGPPSYWDAERGVSTAAEAVELRRHEDRAAADVIGYEPVWLPFDDNGYVYRRDPDQIMAALTPHVVDADVVLVPGWPLKHADHRYVALLLVQQLTDVPVVLYSELPYAASPRSIAVAALKGRSHSPLKGSVPDDVSWESMRVDSSDDRAKTEAIACFGGELEVLGYRARALAAYNKLRRSEGFGFSDGLLQRGDRHGVDLRSLLGGAAEPSTTGSLTMGSTTKGNDGSRR